MMQIFLAMMWRSADGRPTFAFWYAAVLSTLMIAAGIWSLVAPDSLRLHYFNFLNKLPRQRRGVTPSDTWSWKSPTQIRLGACSQSPWPARS